MSLLNMTMDVLTLPVLSTSRLSCSEKGQDLHPSLQSPPTEHPLPRLAFRITQAPNI